MSKCDVYVLPAVALRHAVHCMHPQHVITLGYDVPKYQAALSAYVLAIANFGTDENLVTQSDLLSSFTENAGSPEELAHLSAVFGLTYYFLTKSVMKYCFLFHHEG